MEREPSRAPCALDGRRQSLLRIGMAPDQAWPLSKRAARRAHEFDSAGSPFFLWNLLLPFGLSRELQGRRTSMTLSLKSFRLVDSSSSNWDRSSSSWSLLGPSFGPGSTAIALDQSRSRPKRAARQAHEFDSARSPFCRGTPSSFWSLLGPSFGPGATAIALDQPWPLPRELRGRRMGFDSARSPFFMWTSHEPC